MQRALRIPALPDGWRASFRAMLGQPEAGADGNAGLTAVSPPPAWPGFRPLTVTAIERESDSVTSFRLADPGGAAVPPAQPGQFLTLRLPAGAGAPPLLRSYSLSGAPGADTYRVSVKREPHGAASQFLHTRVRAGDALDVAAPRGTFILQTGTAPVLLISAGVGATPVLAMLHALADSGSGRDVWWLHGARNRAEEPFAAEARSLVDALNRGHRHICYSHPASGDVPDGAEQQSAGRLTPEVLAALDIPRDADAYLCGPASFMAEMSAALASLGIAGARIRTEIFGAAPRADPGHRGGARPATASAPRAGRPTGRGSGSPAAG